MRARLIWAAAALAAFGLGVVFHASYAFDGLAAFDVGILVDGARRTTQGELFGVDFLAPYGPLRYWFVALCFTLLGASLETWCWVGVLLQSAAGAGLLLAAARTSTRLGAGLAFVMGSLAHGAFHKSFLALGSAVAVLLSSAALPATGRASPRRLLGVGAAVGALFLLRYDLGVFCGAALSAGALLRPGERRRIPGWILLGSAAVVLPVVLWLWAAGGDLAEWVELTRQRVSVQERIPGQFPAPGEWGRPLRLALASALLLAPLVHALNLLRALFCRGEHGAHRLSVAVLGLLLLNQARLVPSVNHLFQALPLVFVGLADLCASARAARGRRIGLGVQLGVTLALLAWVHQGHRQWGVYPAVLRSSLDQAVEWTDPRAGIRLSPLERDAYRETVAVLRGLVPPGQSLATGPRSVIFSFLIDRDSATPYSEPSYYFGDPERQQEVAKAWRDRRVRALVYAVQESDAYLRFDREAPALFQAARRDFSAFRLIGPFAVRVREGGGPSQGSPAGGR